MSRPASPEVISYAGAGVSIASSLTLTEWGVIIGIATALLTFALNAIYMYRKDRREEVETAARLKHLEEHHE
ncbi:hypothetical protein GCM10007387_57880 [Pseudoduganella albidiflava]|uniref:Holin n=2 Tax=Pseudoduganella albidiflava TaxID=321983 RepID=A0A411X8F0_9BURK|nr:holin [Pseudoduganella albidiflava]GGY68116.1 hypothetical protein GCM10007387_57880 [Pseudoduganella albidiflava]